MDNDSWWLPTHGRSSEWSAAPVETMLREYRVSVTVRGGWSVAGQSVATRLQLPAPGLLGTVSRVLDCDGVHQMYRRQQAV
jgi:hypothetical protein